MLHRFNFKHERTLKKQHSIDEKSEALQSKRAKTSPGAKNSTGTGQSKIQDVMKNKLPRSGNRATAIRKSIGVFISKDMRPYSVVENKGFQHIYVYLCVPATSVASERVFSSAGHIVSAQRSCLHSEHVDKLLFLKKI